MNQRRDDLEQTQSLFDFLQGNLPEGYKVRRSVMPKLTPDQAWTVIWYLGNQYWQVPDFIERCDVCGHLYDSTAEGECLDFGRAPYFFCDQCCYSAAYEKKAEQKCTEAPE